MDVCVHMREIPHGLPRSAPETKRGQTDGGTDRRTNRQLDGYRIIRGDAIPPPQLCRKGDKNVVK